MEETRAPPSYSDLTHDSNDTATILEDQVIVTLEEVDQAIARNTPQADFSRNDMKTMKRLIEAVLRRNVREQRVLPTELQKEITIAHVITNFNKTKADVQAAASQPSNVSFNASATGEVHILNTTPACKPHPKREQIGVWTTISSDESHSNQILAYADQVPNAIVCMTIWLLITFFVGSPVTLFWTVPALYSIFQTRKNVNEGNITQAKRSFKKYLCLGVIFNLIWTVFFVVVVFVVGIVLAVVFTSPQRV